MFASTLFQQSLQDLVKGIRAHRRDEEEYVRGKVAEIAEECRSSDVTKKTTAVLKLTHVCYVYLSNISSIRICYRNHLTVSSCFYLIIL